MELIFIIKSKEDDDFPLNNKKEFNQALIVTAATSSQPNKLKINFKNQIQV